MVIFNKDNPLSIMVDIFNENFVIDSEEWEIVYNTIHDLYCVKLDELYEERIFHNFYHPFVLLGMSDLQMLKYY